MAQLQPGDLIAEKYAVERVLGQGGMGTVLLARHVDLDEQVAIKVLNKEIAENREALERFMREAKAAVRIKSEHVVRVYDVARLPSGEPYMVMEFLAGSDLEKLLEAGPVRVSDAVDFILQACEALILAHNAGIVHRDLKPANLFVTRRTDGTPCVKVLDFGISKVTTTTGGGMTSTRGLMGSPSFMSPEQLHSAKDVDVRADIWALGVVLYQTLVREFPFVGDTLPQLLVQVMNAPMPSIREKRPEVPPQLEAAISRCLEKVRDDRFPNVGALAKALEPFASAVGRTSVARIMGSVGGSTGWSPVQTGVDGLGAPAATAAPAAPAATGDTPKVAQTVGDWTGTKNEVAGVPKSRTLPLAVGALVVLLGLGGVAYYVRGGGEPGQPTTKAATNKEGADKEPAKAKPTGEELPTANATTPSVSPPATTAAVSAQPVPTGPTASSTGLATGKSLPSVAAAPATASAKASSALKPTASSTATSGKTETVIE